MNYKLIYDNPSEDLLTRLFKVRGIDDNVDSFLDPKLSDYWLDPFLLNDMEKAVERIIKAIKNKEKIMIFGDYDVDGVTSSFILYRFFTKYLEYTNISIQYPDRIQDGYGMKTHHIDDIKSKGVSLIITVDNGIAAVNEALHAEKLGIDMIITDHHKDLEIIPAALAVVNPQISPHYAFKGLAGVGVAFKLICAMLSKSKFDQKKKTQIFNYFLPIVAIGTVSDVVPLIHENRVIVKKGLEMINRNPEHIPSSLRGFLQYLNIKNDIDTYHIGYIIGPRINAGGRINSPYDSLKALLYSGAKQTEHLDRIEEINTERRRLQEEAFKIAEKELNHDKKILIAAREEFHEGIVGIVSGKITEKYNKPSMVLKIDQEKGVGIASLRGPDYFNVIEMVSQASTLLVRFGGHKGAGGLTVRLENLDKLVHTFEEYCNKKVADTDLAKSVDIDTKIYEHERENDILGKVFQLAPFGEGNEEPVFLLENIKTHKIEKVGNNGKSHMKIHGHFGEKRISTLFRGKGEDCEKLTHEGSETMNLIGKLRRDNYNGGFFVDGIKLQ